MAPGKPGAMCLIPIIYHGCMKRRLATLLVFLLLGAVVNIAVAWGLATWMKPRLQSRLVDRPAEADSTWWSQNATPSTHAIAVWRSHATGCDIRSILGTTGTNVDLGHVKLVEQGSQLILYARQDVLLDRSCEISSGWPIHGVRGEIWNFGISLSTPIGMPGEKWPLVRADRRVWSIEFDRPKLLGGSSYRLLPLRPIFPGFAINTVFYAAVCWLLLAAPLAFRRARRRHRGWCVHCGYDLRGQQRTAENAAPSAACPECGRTTPGSRGREWRNSNSSTLNPRLPRR